MNSSLPEPYQLRKRLAQGSDLCTDEVWDAQHERICILKTLHLHQVQDWKRLELFKREARTLAHLEHPQIPRLLAYFEERRETSLSCYLVLEKVPGENLAQRIRGGLQLEEDTSYLIAQQVLRILDYLHRFHPPVVHRDVKPSNLILDDDGVVYLIDFGGVQEILGAGGSTLIGTYGYMAPEQFGGRALPQSDLYGLGASLVYLLSGHEPANMPQHELLLQFRSYVNCSARFANWIEHLLLPAPEQRFQSALEALEVLRDILPHYSHLSLPALQKEVAKAVVDLSELEREPSEHDQSEVPQSHRLPIGSRLRDYLIQAVLGEGDIAITYAATREDGLKVVIRELHFERLKLWKSYELFERELKALQQLKHPALPRLVTHFEDKQSDRHRFYLVSEHLGSQSLEAHLAQGWRPQEPEVRRLGEQLLEILCFLQNQSPPLIHRDIKPSNILLDESREKLYLIDFGAVTEAFRLQGGGGSTVIGTFGYMAPEQFVGKAVPQSDLYGVGATLLHLLAGRSPAEMPQEALRIKFADQINCSRPFYTWLERILDPVINQRFSSPEAALEALKKLDQHPVISQATLQEAEYIVKTDPEGIAITEDYEGLKLTLQPMVHDYKILLITLFGGNLLGVPFLWQLPGLGWSLALALMGGSTFVLHRLKQEGQRYTTYIQVNAEWFHYRTEFQSTSGIQVVDEMNFTIAGIKKLSLDNSEIAYRLALRVQEGRPILRVSKFPLANNKTKAEYLMKRLEETIFYYQKQMKR